MSRIVTAVTGLVLTLGTSTGTYFAVADAAEVTQVQTLKQDAQTVGEALRLDTMAAEDPAGMTCTAQPGGRIEFEMSHIELDSSEQVRCWTGLASDGETHIVVDTSSTDPALAGYVARWDSTSGTTLFKDGAVVTDGAETIEAGAN